MKFSSKALLGVVVAAVANNASVDACIPAVGIGSDATFPVDFVDEKLFTSEIAFLFQPIAEKLFKFMGEKFEQLASPGVRAAQIISMGLYNTVSKYDDIALDAFGLKAFEICPPTVGTEAEKTQLKKAHEQIASTLAIAKIAIALFPELETEIISKLEELEIPLVDDDAAEIAGTPYYVAKFIVDDLIAFIGNDGWNALGKQDMTYNKIPFKDFEFTDPITEETRFPYNYETAESVLSTPGSKRNLRRLAPKFEEKMPQEKPMKEADFSFWKPQLITDGFGQICAEQHLTPQIGATARLYGIDKAYYEAKVATTKPEVGLQFAAGAVEAVEEFAVSDVKKMKAQLFDNPLILFDAQAFKYDEEALTASIIDTIKASDITLLEIASGFLVATTAVYDALLLAFRDKILYNLARPEQIIKEKFAETTIFTFAGPGEGVQNILGKEFKSFIKTPATAEFPSAHSAMYKAAAEAFEILFAGDVFEKFEIKFAAGSSLIEPGTKPEFETTIEFTSFSEIAQAAADSRVGAGVSFPEATMAGQELAAGLADIIYAKATKLIEGDATGKFADFTADREIVLKKNIELQAAK